MIFGDDAMMRPDEALMRAGRVARTRQLHALGCTDKTLRNAERTGQIVRLRKGVWSTDPSLPESIAAMHGGSAACLTVLALRGVWLLEPPSSIHVHVGPGGRIHAHEGCECVSHFEPAKRRFGAVPLREALVQSRSCQTREAFFAAFESAWNLRLLSAADRKWIRDRLPNSWKKLIDIARANAQSGLESILRLRLHYVGLSLKSQVDIPTVGRVDFVIDDVILEVDGRLGHADPSSRHKDLRRDARATALGYRVLRFDYALVIHDWPMVLAAVLRALHIS